MSNKSNCATVKKRSILLSGLFVLTMCLAGYAAADYPPNVADAIPDREFRTLCLRIADTDGDGAISREEALAVTKIRCPSYKTYGKTISSLEGLHYFANLETLDCSSQNLTSLDVSGNPRLRRLWCYFNPLVSLDAGGCSALELLICETCELECLRLPRTAALKKLDCSSNRLASLDVSGCPALRRLTCYDNPFTELNVDACPDLELLDCSCLVTSDLRHHEKLYELHCGGLPCVRLDLSEFKQLSHLSITHSRISEIVFGDSDLLISFALNDVDFTSLDLSGCHQLMYLTLTDMPLRELTLPETELSSVELRKLPLERLEVKGYVKIGKLAVSDCGRLKCIDGSGQVMNFDCCNCSNLTMLNMDAFRYVGDFRCTGTALTSLDFSRCNGNRYAEINCSDNRLTTLVLPPEIYTLSCQGNLLEELDISGCSINWIECRPMETLRRIRLRRDQNNYRLGGTKGIELVYVD